jgi:hypothetical protein
VRVIDALAVHKDAEDLHAMETASAAGAQK